tara:strand:- start:345 stop:1784 length:1440 start_codon:yes stop_codon:yes gene_type:complete
MAIKNLKEELEDLSQIFFFKKTKAAGGTGSGSEDEFRALMNEEAQLFTIKARELQSEIKLRAPNADSSKIKEFADKIVSKGMEYFSAKPTTKNVTFEVEKVSDGIEVIVRVKDPKLRGKTGKKTNLFAALQKFKKDVVNPTAESYPEIFGNKEEGNIFTKTSKTAGTYWNIVDIGHEDAVAAGKAASVRGTLEASGSEISDIKQELLQEFEKVVETPNELELEHFQDIIDAGGKLQLSDNFIVRSSLEDSAKNQVEKGGKQEAKIGSDISAFLQSATKRLEKEYKDPKTAASRKRSASIQELGFQMIINNQVMRGMYKKRIATNLSKYTQRPKSKRKVKVSDREKLQRKKRTFKGIVLTSEIPLPNRRKTRDGGDNELLRKAMETRAFVQTRLTKEIQRNMGRPALENQTGRFAQSANLINVVPQGNGLHMDYTYDPRYKVFEDGVRYSKNYDPRPLIERSIRELAAQKLETKFTLRRI